MWKSIRSWSKLNDGTVWLAVVRAMTGDVPQSKTLLYSTSCKHYDVVCTQIFLSQKDSIVFILILSCSILWHLLMSTSFSRIFEVAPPVLSRVFQELSAGIWVEKLKQTYLAVGQAFGWSKIVFSVSLVHLLSFKSLRFTSRNMCFFGFRLPVKSIAVYCMKSTLMFCEYLLEQSDLHLHNEEWWTCQSWERSLRSHFHFHIPSFLASCAFFWCTGSWQVCVVLHWYTWSGLITNCTFFCYYCTTISPIWSNPPTNI